MAQITLTVNPTPLDAEVRINNVIGNTSSVDSGTDVSILVSKSGYSTLEIINRYTTDKTVDVELQPGDDLEPTITIVPPTSGTTTLIDNSKVTSKSVPTGTSVNISAEANNYVTFRETIVLNHSIKKYIYLESGRAWFTDNSDRTISGFEQKIRPLVELKTNASYLSFGVTTTYQQENNTDWVRNCNFLSGMREGDTFNPNGWLKTNISGETRSAIISVGRQTGSTSWDEFLVTQEALPACIVKDSITVNNNKTTGYLSVACPDSSTRWTVSTNNNWITLSGTIGTGSVVNGITYTIAENPSSLKRTGSIVITVGSSTMNTVSVIQQPDPSITPPKVDKNFFEISEYKDTDITINISDPYEQGWKLDGYVSFNYAGERSWDTTYFKGVLNPNDDSNKHPNVSEMYPDIDWSHPEFGTTPSTTPTERVTGLISTDYMRCRTGVGDASIRVLFSKEALGKSGYNRLYLMNSNLEMLDKIEFQATDEVIAQWDEEYGDHSEATPKPEPGGVYFHSDEMVLDVGDTKSAYVYSYIDPPGARGSEKTIMKDGSLINWTAGNCLSPVKAGISYIWGKVQKSDGTWTTESSSYTKLQVVVWDKNNLTQEFQFEDHKTIALDYGNSKTIKLLKKSTSKLKASDIYFYPPCSTYSVSAVDTPDGNIDVTITAGAKKSAAWLMAIYGGIIDKVAVVVAGGSGPRSGCNVSTQSASSTQKGTSQYWTPNYPVMYQMEGGVDAGISLPGITLLESETKVIRGKVGAAPGSVSTYRSMEKYHLDVEGNSVQVGDLSPIDLDTDGTWGYEFAVGAVKPGVSYVNIRYNADNTIVARYMAVVREEDSSELKTINLTSIDTKYIPGKTYNLFFKCTPYNYNLRNYNPQTKLYSNRQGVSLFTETDDPYSCIESCSVITNPDRANSGNAYYCVSVKFKSSASGRVGIRLGVNDNGNRVVSNTLILDVSPENTLTSGSISFDTPEITAAIEEGEVDLSQHLVFFGQEETDSKYYCISGSDANGAIVFSSNGKSIIPKAPGESRLYVKYHYRGIETSDPGIKDSSDSVLVKVIDKSDLLVQSFNIRFKVPKVEIDRSAKIYRPMSGGTTDLAEQLSVKYGVRSVSELVLHDDPYGAWDGKRLVVRFETETGQPIVNASVPGYDVAYRWGEGTVYLAAYYGTLKSTESVCRAKIPYIVYTSDPNFIPIRSLTVACRIPDATLPKWSDFSTWYPITKFFNIVPKDAILSSSGFQWNASGIGGDGCRSEVVHVQRYNPNGKTFDEKYRVRLAGFGGQMIARSWKWGGVSQTGYDGGMEVCWPDGTEKGNKEINNIVLSTTKANIRRGECTYIKATCTPDLDFGMVGELKYSMYVDGKYYKTVADVNSLGTFDIVCVTRKGIIVRGGSVAGTHTLKVIVHSANKFHQEFSITLENMPFNNTKAEPEISIQLDSNGRIIDNQILSVSDGTVVGWGTNNWLIASITPSGLLRTYTEGNIAIYAVLSDGRLAMYSGMTQDTITGWLPIDPHESITPQGIDTEIKESKDSKDNVDLGFEDKSSVYFSSNASDPVYRRIKKGSTSFSLSSVSCTVEKPGIVSATCVMISGELHVKISPIKKGTSKVYVLYGGSSDYVFAEVINGESYVPSISYADVTGVSLNVFEYTDIPFKANSRSVYDRIILSSDNDGIVVDKKGYDVATGIGTLIVTLKDKVSGKIMLDFNNTEHLEFSVVNRYNLAFESTSNFILGVGATRYIKIYPLDDLIKDSDVFVSSRNGNVDVGQIMESVDSLGKRVFVVPITYKSPGPDVLVASREGDSDIYLEFDCEAKSVPATSIKFNIDSINIEL